jgi:bacteriochlorophyll 4-vinyl reductase
MAIMMQRTQEIAMPAAAFSALRAALIASAGEEAAADALRTAGHAAGDAFYQVLAARQDPATLTTDRFWRSLNQLFSSRGWGQFSYTEAHPGVGELSAAEWADAEADGRSAQPACHFTTGLLANLLGRVAGGDVAVLEVACRSRGDQHCRFLFGGADAVYAVYERLADGENADAALQQIG